MKDEIAAAVVFLTRLINLKRTFTQEQMDKLSENLAACLIEKFRNHWYEEKPSKGQAFRSLRFAKGEPRDTVLLRAAKKTGLEYSELNLPSDFTLWVDPLEVVCRFGEKGTFCPVATFPKTPSSQTNDNITSSTQSNSDDNVGCGTDANANPKIVIESITAVLQKNNQRRVLVNDNAAYTTHRRGHKNRTKTNRQIINVVRSEDQDWPVLSHDQFHWVNKSLATKA